MNIISLIIVWVFFSLSVHWICFVFPFPNLKGFLMDADFHVRFECFSNKMLNKLRDERITYNRWKMENVMRQMKSRQNVKSV